MFMLKHINNVYSDIDKICGWTRQKINRLTDDSKKK